VGGLVGIQPVVHGTAADAQEVGDLGDGAAGVDFEDRKGPAVHRGVARRQQLLAEPLPLPGVQVQFAHGPPH